VDDFNLTGPAQPSIAIVRVDNNTKTSPQQKEFDFVALTPIVMGTKITFTDYGWKAGGGFNMQNGSEGSYTWNAERNFSAGEVITIAASNNVASGLKNINLNGDQIFALAGTDLQTNPTFLYGINFGQDVASWQNNAGTNKDSTRPSGLANDTSVVVGTVDGKNNNSYRYIGTLCGTKEELLAKIGDSNNWERSAQRPLDPVRNFSVLS
jgi:hypothetical protein